MPGNAQKKPKEVVPEPKQEELFDPLSGLDEWGDELFGVEKVFDGVVKNAEGAGIQNDNGADRQDGGSPKGGEGGESAGGNIGFVDLQLGKLVKDAYNLGRKSTQSPAPKADDEKDAEGDE